MVFSYFLLAVFSVMMFFFFISEGHYGVEGARLKVMGCACFMAKHCLSTKGKMKYLAAFRFGKNGEIHLIGLY